MNLKAIGSRLSERQQVALIIGVGGAALFLLWYFLLMPMNARRHRLEQQIASMSNELAQRNYLLGEDALGEKKVAAAANLRRLQEEWLGTVGQLNAFTNGEVGAKSEIGHIDFKVALFDTRQRLLGKSRALGISLPHDFGVEEPVDSDEDPRQRMLELRVVERLVDLVLDQKIKTVREVTPKPAITHTVGSDRKVFLQEYPLEITFYGSTENLYALLGSILQPEHVFVVRSLRAEAASRNSPGLLSVRAVISALVFADNLAELTPPPAPGATRARVRGY